MRAFAVLRQSLAENFSASRNPVIHRPLLSLTRPVVATVNCQRHFGAAPRCHKYRPVYEEEWTITKEEWEEEEKLVRSLRSGIWAGQNGRMLDAQG